MNILALIALAVLISFLLGVALGKVLRWSAQAFPTVEPTIHENASEPYPRWYE